MKKTIDKVDESVYIGGYFSELMRSGVKPEYGYPADGGLKEPTIKSMEVVTGFMASKREK